MSLRLPELVLASASPRRQELLARLKLRLVVRPVNLDERTPSRGNPEIIARRLARTKAEAARLVDPDSVIIAADTVVAVDGSVLGKPADAGDAQRMLKFLRGRTHEVVSAVAIMRAEGRSALVRHPVTRVVMRDYPDAEVDASISRGDPFDKAGAYAIQDEAFRPVERYDGCYCNVVGLSLWATIELLRKADVKTRVSVQQLLPQCASCPLKLRS
ncbi:MAG: septum formation protein Maf [Chloroflexi bacterium]|nr:MAG: septum formation protein Maf [Chloroflexota bacterium]